MSESVDSLLTILESRRPWVALTGAGISSASGIPTYRDHKGTWLGSQPIQHDEFISDSSKRQRYWSRSALGWPRVSAAQSNESHATPSYRALGVVKDLGNPPDESAESESDGCGLGRKNFACRGLRLEPRGEDSAVSVQVGLSTRVDFASVSSRVGNLCHSIYLSRGFISAHCSSFVF